MRRIRLTVGARAVPRRMMNECLRHMLKYICSSPISLFDFLRLTFAKAKEMLKRTAAPGVSRLVGAYWVRWPGRTFCPRPIPPSSHLASWHLSIKTAEWNMLGETESSAILKAANAQNTKVNIWWKLGLVPFGSTVCYEILKLCSGSSFSSS